MAARLDEAFARLGDTVTEIPDLREILQGYLEAGLEADWEYRTSALPGRPVYAQKDSEEDPVAADLAEVSDWLGDAREQLAMRDTRAVKPRVDALMAAYSVSEEHRKALSMGVLAANVEVLERVKERVLGRFAEYVPAASVTASPPTPTTALPSGPLFSVFVESYCDFGTKENGWKGQTLAQNRTTFEMFKEIAGDKQLSEYTRTDTGNLYEALRKLPSLYSKDARWRDLPIQDAIEASASENVPRLTMKTIKRHFSALGGLFTYAKRLGQYAGENPAHGFVFPKKGRARTARKMWEGEPLTKLFASPVWTGSHRRFRSQPGAEIIKDDHYWLPLLGVYHGNRLEEFAQLRREDIKQEDGVWFFNITDEGERQLKNEQSKRRVPIHPKIIELGFLDFARPKSANEKTLVFETLKPGGPDKKFGFYFSKWFTAYRRSVGVYEPKLDYHSFRHGVTTKLISAGVQPSLVDELTGHEGKGTSEKIYYKGANLLELHAAIKKIEWPEISLKNA